MTTLLLADHDNAALSEQTAKALTAALAVGDIVHALVAGNGARTVAEAASRLSGVSKVLLADDMANAGQLAEPTAELIVRLAPGYVTIMAAATSTGKSILPRVAALLDVAQVSEIVEVVAPDTFKRPIYAGNAIQTVRASGAKRVVTVRTASFASAGETGSAPIENVSGGGASEVSRLASEALSSSDRPDLSSARIVVSGGRALASAENFEKLIFPLAEKLGAAIGASRAAVDAGYASNDLQVGQTGKVVAPDLYVACGISGAIQHMAGMKDSKVIVAINKDADAPIFQIADYGLVADIFEALPELAREL